MIATLAFAAAAMFAVQGATSAADSHNPPTPVSGVDVRATPVIPTQASIEKKLKSEGESIICKRRQVSGSRMPGPRVCATNTQWADLTYQEQSSVRTQQSRTRM